MTIVAKAETRNSQWANDQSSFGRRMLSKMGWRGDGSGLGKDQQGSSVHLRAVRRVESLGIGAENDTFGDKGWKDTNAGFHGVLASLKREYGGGTSEDGGGGGRGRGTKEEEGKKRRRKRERKDERKKRRVKREEERTRKKKRGYDDDDDGEGSDVDNNGKCGGRGSVVRLPHNIVQAGHARKMREAKDIRNKSAEDMAAIFGIKADQYKRQSCWGGGGANPPSPSDVASDEGWEGGKSRKKIKGRKRLSGESSKSNVVDECDETDGAGGSSKVERRKDKKKRDRSCEVECDPSDERKRRKKKDKSKK
ncbi:hypothetical protein ACHAXA_003657 [Cyclostephanos tholiformis]|uniref:G-patch domain-containing protein n=1 Tax=Cyclostephanos tholiformis TaxID=382380 RepID=A0ABD3SQ37_9STRA